MGMENQRDQEKLNSLNAMIRNGKSKISAAELMLEAAQHKKDHQQIEIATAALHAAHHHMAELKQSKAAILGKVHAEEAELGEIHDEIENGSRKMHKIADDAVKTQTDLGAAQFAADEEGEETEAEAEVDRLHLQLAKV